MATDLTIEKLIYGGDGLARIPSGERAKSVFVPFALPGELVRANFVEDKKSYARAVIEDVLQPSHDRVSAACRYFGRCGGCQYQHASYEAQLAAKRSILIESLQRTAAISLPVPLATLPSSEPLNYRNRTRVHLQHTPHFALGYYRAGTHELLPIDHCPISSPLVNKAIAALWRCAAAGALPLSVSEIEIFADDSDARCLLELYVGGRRPTDSDLQRCFDTLARELHEAAGTHFFAKAEDRHTRVMVVQHVAGAGEPALSYRVLDFNYRVSAGSFFQVNRYLLPHLLARVAGGLHGAKACDLYAGVGLFSLPLAAGFEVTCAVESSPFSYADLEANLPAKPRRYCQSTESFLNHRGSEILGADVVLLDPPRAGIGVNAAKLLASIMPAEIRYLSCDPVTLARDLQVLLQSGYRITEACLIDMFPQTMHIESFVRLTSSRHESR